MANRVGSISRRSVLRGGVTLTAATPFVGAWSQAARASQSSYQADITVYVATSGRAGASGTISDPFPSIEAARDALAGKTNSTHRGLVYLRGGEYQFSDTVALQGPANSYVTYAAYQDENVIITGTTTLSPSDFIPLSQVSGSQFSSSSRIQSAVRAQVYAYDLGAAGIPVGTIDKNGFNWQQQPWPPDLIANGTVQTIAQYPNAGSYLTSADLQTVYNPDGARDYFPDKTDSPLTYDQLLQLPAPVFQVSSTSLAARYGTWGPPTPDDQTPGSLQPLGNVDNSTYETDGWLSGYFGNNYGNDMLRIYSVDTNGTDNISCQYPSMYTVTAKYIQVTGYNILSELDMPGEYYIDRWQGNNVLYYYPAGDLTGMSISLTSLAVPFFALNGVTGVTLSGVSINGTTGNAIALTDCTECCVEYCDISNCSMDAVEIGQSNGEITAVQTFTTTGGGHRNIVQNNTIHAMGGGGVFLAGGDRQSLERGDNIVRHNEFYDFSRLVTYTPAVYMDGVGNTAEYNYIHDAPHMVIQIMGNDMVVSHNIIENVVNNASDMGAIYSGRDYTWLGNEISYNYFKNISGSSRYAIYMDDGMSAMDIHHNFFDTIDTAIFFNEGHSSVCTDNVYLNCGAVAHMWIYPHTLPISNASVLIDRFTAMLKAGDGTNYTNTAANVRRWQGHYRQAYPNIAQWYVPAADASDYDTWENPDSVYVPSHDVVARTVRINTADVVLKASSGVDTATFNPGLNADNVSASDPAAFGFDTSTGKFAPDSSLAGTSGFGQGWIEQWNNFFTLRGIGVISRNG